MTRALALLLLASCACSASPEERRDQAISTALEAARLGCLTALNDPKTEWEPGAREYCVLVATGGCPK